MRRFDSIHTIQIPKDGTPERGTFIATARIGRLHKDFAHDLHLRLFRAFASLGFDDQRWFSTDDLRTLVTMADRDLSKKNTELLEIQSELQVGRSQSFHHPSEKDKLEKVEANLQAEIRKMTDEAKPYRDEHAGR